MTPEKWNKIKALFSSAQDYPLSERNEFLDHACGGDAEIKNEVEKLLESYGEDDDFLENSAIEQFADVLPGDPTAGMGDPLDTAPRRFENGVILNDRYEIVRMLSRGGMGEVYLANDTRISRNVALKVLHSDLGSNKESLRRFALEAQAVSALNHPHIMTIHEFDTAADGTVFFVAEFVDGQILNHLIGKDLKLDKALDIAIQISSALSAAHDAGITHRDIKPENIMVRRDGYIKVLDFGLAKLTQHSPSIDSLSSGSEAATKALNRTKPGAVMGTAAYMSPEQARGIAIDMRTDVWSLGVVIYELVTGHRPFGGETSADILVSVLTKEPPPMSSYVQNLPGELEFVVLKALSKDVEGRYQTSSELRIDLQRIKKRIEFDDNLSRSQGEVSESERPAGAKQGRKTAESGVPTSDDTPAEAASDGSSVLNGPPSFWPTSIISTAFQNVRSQKARYSIVSLLLVGLISSVVYFGFVMAKRAPEIDSIAVLPFQNLSGNPDLTYVSDGLSESVIDRLSELPQLKVISRNSSFKFRGQNLELKDVASRLGVRAILTGSVTQAGEDLVIRYDLVDAPNDRQITGGQFRRKAGDILRVQNEIASAASEQLRLKLTDTQAKRLRATGTENSEAFRYYLSGLVEMNSGPVDMQDKALDHFEHAVALDPDFSAAFAEIGWIYWYRANGNDDPHKLIPKAKTAALRALEIDPDLAKAHVIMAAVSEYEFDWQTAEKEYRRAIELSPNLGDAHNSYALYLSVMGRHEDALYELEQQQTRDPINRYMGLLWKGAILAAGRKFDEALQTYQEAKALEPDKEIQPIALAYAYAGKGMYREAAGFYEKAAGPFGGAEKYSQPLVYLAATYARIPDKRNEAITLLDKIEGMNGYKSPALLAAAYAELGQKDRSMALLERAFIERDLLLRYIGTAYEYDELRGDPRFEDLIRRLGIRR